MAEGVFNPNCGPIAEAINKVMTTVGYIEKKGANTFHNYKFAAIGDVLAKVQPAMAAAGLIIIQNEEMRELLVNDSVLSATYEFRLVHTSGAEWEKPIRHTGMASARNSKGGFDDKAINKCHTAARKYFILGLFQIPTGDLPDVECEEEKSTTVAVGSHGAPIEVPKKSAYKSKKDQDWEKLTAEINGIHSAKELESWRVSKNAEITSLPDAWQIWVDDYINARSAELVASK